MKSLRTLAFFAKAKTDKWAKRLQSALLSVAVWAVLHVAPVFFGKPALLPERDEPLGDQVCCPHPHKEGLLSVLLLERWHVLYTAAPWMWRRRANQISQRSHQLYCQPRKRVFITLTPPRPLSCHSVTHPPGQLCCVTSDFDFIKRFLFLCFVLFFGVVLPLSANIFCFPSER